MQSVSLLKTSHEDLFLLPGFYLAFEFRSGYVIARILGREWANLKPYSVGAIVAGANLATWNEILDPTAKHYLEPAKRDLWYHIFWGVNTPNARVYVRFPTKNDIGSLTTTTRAVKGDVGYVDGSDSPYDGPLSVKTELFTLYERYPAFQVSNVTEDDFANVMFNFSVMKYSYQLIKDKRLIEQLLVGGKSCKRVTVGPVDPGPTTAPKWLEDLVGFELMNWTKELVESEGAGIATGGRP